MATPIEQRGYAHPDALVSTDWVEQHLSDPSVRVIESNEDTLLYSSGHVPGSVHVDWTSDLNDQLRRDYITPDDVKSLVAPVVTHRITLSPEAEMEGLALEDLLKRIFDQVEVPR